MTRINEIARFPASNDNAAIALRDLPKGLVIAGDAAVIELHHDVLMGHRFAATDIRKGEFITSWEYPFGRASRDIEAGEYLCNQNVLFRLSIQEDKRYTSLDIPTEANFTDDIPPYRFDEQAWREPAAVELYENGDSFQGFERGERGVGTRNHLVILGTTASTAALVQKLESQYEDRAKSLANVDAIVGIRHTEGEETAPEERDRTLRTLAGLVANPNVGGFLAIESGLPGELTNAELVTWMQEHDIPEMRQQLLTTTDSVEHDLEQAAAAIEELLVELETDQRTAQPLSELKIGLQCGASDAFSGISGNVLSGAIAREVIRHGGAANLTETPELSGAEDYTLSSISEPGIATRFLGMLDRFKEQLGWHGGKVDKNPSEGNLLGGLYNITLKSLGAAVKRDPDIPIRHIVEYAERMDAPGFYFMDGMGGDIASYTGQAASGCNLVLFVTGRGTPTNSSIVPTIKIVNTTERHGMMAGDIDINAGQYLDGQSMDDLTDECLTQIVEMASGNRTKGEKRRQNIDLIWRRKFFHHAPESKAAETPSRLGGKPLVTPSGATSDLKLEFAGWESKSGVLPQERVALIIPTVGCSAATAEQAATHLNKSDLIGGSGVNRFVVLPNTEGCGVTTGAEVLNFMLGYSVHTRVEACLFLSLGCEMVSPGLIKSAMTGGDIGFPDISASADKHQPRPDQFGWITIQDSGGTEHSVAAIESWFRLRLGSDQPPIAARGHAKDVRLGIATTGKLSKSVNKGLADFAGAIVGAGGTVVMAEDSKAVCVNGGESVASLAFAQRPDQPGLHVMQSVTRNRMETITGLGAATDVVIHFSAQRATAAHILVPTLNITDSSDSPDFDFKLQQGQEKEWPQQLADIIGDVLSGSCTPRQNALGQVGNQIPRGARAHAI